ncbi:MAG: ParB/RepB/Spo0J family partition protein [Candidatus Competibacteraceae bacterium]|nr:ParB/RepB/Spo0J family partition protein [Candidatus Competibacteraceae bacterium]
MVKKKTFGLPAGLPLADIVEEGEAEAGSFVMEILPIARIEPDPDNPRRLGLNPANPRELDKSDPLYERKKVALEGIEDLAISVARFKVQQPIKVYRYDKGYRIVFGERRYLASILAEEKTIPAWVLPERPKFLRTLQFSENEHHDKLDAWERLESITSVVREFESYGEEVIGSAKVLAELTGLKLSMANNYFDLIQGPDDVLEALRARTITNIQLAAEIAREPDLTKRLAALDEARLGAISDRVRSVLKQSVSKPRTSGRGRPAKNVTLGRTANTVIVRRIVEAVLGDACQEALGSEIQWDDFSSVTDAWKKFLAYLESVEKSGK